MAVSSAEPGSERLGVAARELATLLGMKCSFIGILEGEKVQTIALWLDGELREGITYDLAGTPCEQVYKQDVCFHGSGVQDKFPDDEMLVEIGAESYMATPITSSLGAKFGHVGLMDGAPMEAGIQEHAILRLFSSLVGSELNAQASEARRLEIERKMLEGHRLESLGVLAGGIAHDFNNLLVGITGNISLALTDAQASSPVRKYLEQIEITSHRAADLAQQMLAYSGKGRFVVVNANLSEIVEEMTNLLIASIDKSIVVRYDLAEDLPAVRVDATQMRQLIMNLVLNAADAIEDKSGIISITTGVVRVDRNYLMDASLGQDRPEGDYVFLEVADSGCGMTPETIRHMFDPFFSGKPDGRGLGLAAVQGIVAGHEGALKVYSELRVEHIQAPSAGHDRVARAVRRESRCRDQNFWNAGPGG